MFSFHIKHGVSVHQLPWYYQPQRLLPVTWTSVMWYKSKVCDLRRGSPERLPFSTATTPRCRKGRYPFPGLFHFTIDPYLIILSGIKYHFLSLWYDLTWDWPLAMLLCILIHIYIYMIVDDYLMDNGYFISYWYILRLV